MPSWWPAISPVCTDSTASSSTSWAGDGRRTATRRHRARDRASDPRALHAGRPPPGRLPGPGLTAVVDGAMGSVATSGVVGLVVSLVATFFCERIARRAGVVAHPRADRWRREPVPLLGGLSIMAGVTATVLLVSGNVARF